MDGPGAVGRHGVPSIVPNERPKFPAGEHLDEMLPICGRTSGVSG